MTLAEDSSPVPLPQIGGAQNCHWRISYCVSMLGESLGFLLGDAISDRSPHFPPLGPDIEGE
jgi:hypothetical protein